MCFHFTSFCWKFSLWNIKKAPCVAHISFPFLHDSEHLARTFLFSRAGSFSRMAACIIQTHCSIPTKLHLSQVQDMLYLFYMKWNRYVLTSWYSAHSKEDSSDIENIHGNIVASYCTLRQHITVMSRKNPLFYFTATTIEDNIIHIIWSISTYICAIHCK